MGLWLDKKLLFNVHIAYLVKKFTAKIYPFNAKKTLVEVSFLPVIVDC